ncbi:ABC transporter permease [Bosea sp. Root670]|uniref:ABC transporter permease n=1 Tax=Bosea sp. Root670 TaxID=1736583 RepID=UPI0009EC263F|nr:ABC transporter permease [Bosea sp. Root670]
MSDETEGPQHIRRTASPSEGGIGACRILRSVWRNRALVREMTHRELTDMHAGQAAGVIWLVVHPLFLFAVYAFLFSVVFSMRIGEKGPTDYLVYLFSGLAPWLMTADVLARSSNVIVSNAAIVKKVTFPTEVLIAKTVLASVLVQGLLFACVVVYAVVTRGYLPWSFLLLPVVFGIHLALLWGLAILLASLTPYFRDVPELVRIFVTINIYLVPIVYLPNMVPGALRFVVDLNPFSYLIWCYQEIIYYENIRRPAAWLGLIAFSGAAVLAGSYVFSRLRHHFSSVV